MNVQTMLPLEDNAFDLVQKKKFDYLPIWLYAYILTIYIIVSHDSRINTYSDASLKYKRNICRPLAHLHNLFNYFFGQFIIFFRETKLMAWENLITIYNFSIASLIASLSYSL